MQKLPRLEKAHFSYSYLDLHVYISRRLAYTLYIMFQFFKKKKKLFKYFPNY